MNQRHRSRRLALQGLSCLDVQGAPAQDMVEAFMRDSQEPQAVEDALRLLRETLAEKDDCDRMLARHARHWELSRLALVDRNILRLAVHEMRQGGTPVKVIISEALRLAQEFSTADSPRFINGVLDAVAREIAADTGKPFDDSKDSKDGET